VVHQSRVEHAPGIKLKDLAANSTDSTSILTAFRLLLDRCLYTGTSRKKRSHYESVCFFLVSSSVELMKLFSRRPWSLYILFFIVILVMETSLVFVLGRLIDISTTAKVMRSVFFTISKSSPMCLISISKKRTKRLPLLEIIQTKTFHTLLN